MTTFTNQEQQVINAALNVIHTLNVTHIKFSKENGLAFPVEIKNYLRIRLACDNDEWLCAMFLNNQYRLIGFQRPCKRV